MSTEPSSAYADWYPEVQGPGNVPVAQPPQKGAVNTGVWTKPHLDAGGPQDSLYGVPIASGWRRLLAGTVDLATTTAPLVVVSVYASATGREPGAGAPGAFAVALAVVVVNSFLLTTSFGKRLTGIQVVRPIRYSGGQAFARPGAWRTLVRLFLHVFEVATHLWLVAFFTRRRRTAADALTHVIHIRVEGGPDKALPKAPYGSVDLA